MRSCDPAAPDCLDGEYCYDYGDGTGVCWPSGDGTGSGAGEGEYCDGDAFVCGAGLMCVGDTCFRACDPGSPSCESGEYCYDYGDGTGVCWPTGGGDSITVGEGDTCDDETQVCGGGLWCIEGTCHRACDPTSPTCLSGEYCYDYGDGTGVCWPDGTGGGDGFTYAGLGDDCDEVVTYCDSGLACHVGTCLEVCDPFEFEACGEFGNCNDYGDYAVCE
jgi:hypothetical protein